MAGNIAILKNTGTGVATFAHNSGASSAGNKLFNIITSAPTPVAAGGFIAYQYDGTQWQCIWHEQGAPIPWTPTDVSGAGLSLTTINPATYVVKGLHVAATLNIQYPATASVLTVLIGGLPFTAANYQYSNSIGFTTYGAFLTSLTVQSSQTIGLWTPTNGVQVTNVGMSSASIFLTTGYETT